MACDTGTFRRTAFEKPDVEIDALISQIVKALEGDSNDAEHDALSAVADFFDIDWTAYDDVLADKTFLAHVNFELPRDCPFTADELAEWVKGALEVGVEGAPPPAGDWLQDAFTVTLVEEV